MTEKTRIVLVEDHASIRDALKAAIHENSDERIAVVGDSGDGETALRLVQELKPDVVLLDLVLTESAIGGIDLLRQIRKISGDVRVLVFTGYTTDELVFGAIAAQPDGYQLKTVDGHTLVDSIEAVARGEVVLHDTIARRLIQDYASQKTLLTSRESEICGLLANGKSNDDIAAALSITPDTVKSHLSNIYRKFGVSGRQQAVRRYRRLAED